MKKNSSLPQFKALNVMNITSPSALNTTASKKIQGFDMGSTTKSNTFTTKVEQLKNRANKQSI